MSMTERRAVPRFEYELSVSFRDGDRRIAAVTHTIGRHGVFVRTPTPRRAGELIQMDLSLPPGPHRPPCRIQVMAVVSWTVAAGEAAAAGSPPGMGVRFFMLGAADKQRWDAFMLEATTDLELAEEGRAARADEEIGPREPLSSTQEPIRFLVRARNLGHLKAFGERELASGLMFLRTPLMRPVDEPVRVVLIHPVTEEELPVDGRVARQIQDGPITARGMDIELVHTGQESLKIFHHFVNSGGLPRREGPGQRLEV